MEFEGSIVDAMNNMVYGQLYHQFLHSTVNVSRVPDSLYNCLVWLAAVLLAYGIAKSNLIKGPEFTVV